MPIGILIALALLAPTLSASCIAHLEVPKYPEIARLSRVEGAITVDVSIGADGKVVSTTASGVAMLREAAEENAKHWTFQPETHYITCFRCPLCYSRVARLATQPAQ